jgi:outer membrane immunogenic protein
MMRKTLLASVSAAALGCSTIMPAQAASPTPTWTGFYVGLNAGYAWGHSDPALVDAFLTLANPPGLNPRGFIGGGQIGYNWQSGQWVFGAEVDLSGLNAKADATISPFFAFKGTNGVSWSSQYDWLFTARLRGGFTVAPNWLLYATGGLAVTHVNDSACNTLVSGCSGGVRWSDSSNLTGGTIGGGIETMFAPNWTARVEYLYAKFKDTTLSPSISGFPQFSFDHNLNVVRFAINYKFGP